jgi:hypothetical protein
VDLTPARPKTLRAPYKAASSVASDARPTSSSIEVPSAAEKDSSSPGTGTDGRSCLGRSSAGTTIATNRARAPRTTLPGLETILETLAAYQSLSRSVGSPAGDPLILEASSGTTVTATRRLASSAYPTARAWSLKSWLATPSR